MPGDSPIKVKSGSFVIESDEPLDKIETPQQEPPRPYTYKRQSKGGSEQDQEVQIRYVVVRNVTNGDEEFKREYQDEKCEIDIYWARPTPPKGAP